MNLNDAKNNRLLRFTARMNSNKVMLQHKINGEWGKAHNLEDPSPPFPFQKGQQFSMNFTALADNVLSVRMGRWVEAWVGEWMEGGMGRWRDW